MRLTCALILAAAVMAGCAHNAPSDCHVESGWLDATNGCSARAGYPDCYQVCANGSRVRVQNSSDLTRPPGGPPAQKNTAPQQAKPVGSAPQQ
jgi:hypothetical protein